MTRLDDMDAKAFTEATFAALIGLGGSATTAEIVQRVAQDLDLSDEDITRPHGDGVTTLYYRLGWARTWLKTEGLFTTSSTDGGR